MTTRNLERRIARLEQARPNVRLDLSQVPTAELEAAVEISQRYGVDSQTPAGQQSAQAQEAALAEIRDKCPELWAAYDLANGG